MRPVLLLARKDLRTLVRSRALLVALLVYPLVIAALLGSLLLSATESAVIAIVDEDETGQAARIGDEEFGIERYRQQAERAGVNVVEMHRDQAMRALEEGQVVGVLVIPDGFMARLETGLSPGRLQFHTGDHALGTMVVQRVRGVAYEVNLQISRALIEVNSEYLQTLVEGGSVTVLGDRYFLYGLSPAEEELRELRDRLPEDDPQRDELDRIIEFADNASIAMQLAERAMEATATPLRIEHVEQEGKSPQLTASALSFALSVSLAFICVILVAASLAAERDERVMGRLLRGIVGGWQVLAGKLLVGAVLGVVFSIGLFAMFALLAPQAWTRLPLLVLSVAIASVAFAAVGTLLATLTRDARAATLVGLVIVLPLIPLGLLPGNEVADAISAAFPFAPAQAVFNATLFEAEPLDALARGWAHLLVIAAVATTLARVTLRRLV